MYFEAVLDSTMREVRIFMLPDEEGRLPEREACERIIRKAALHQKRAASSRCTHETKLLSDGYRKAKK